MRLGSAGSRGRAPALRAPAGIPVAPAAAARTQTAARPCRGGHAGPALSRTPCPISVATAAPLSCAARLTHHWRSWIVKLRRFSRTCAPRRLGRDEVGVFQQNRHLPALQGLLALEVRTPLVCGPLGPGGYGVVPTRSGCSRDHLTGCRPPLHILSFGPRGFLQVNSLAFWYVTCFASCDTPPPRRRRGRGDEHEEGGCGDGLGGGAGA